MKNVITCNGALQLFMSINLRYCPERLCYVKPAVYGTMDKIDWAEIDSISEVEFITILSENCGVAAKMFQTRPEAFDPFLRTKSSGAFPGGMITADVFIKIEFQRSGIKFAYSRFGLAG